MFLQAQSYRKAKAQLMDHETLPDCYVFCLVAIALLVLSVHFEYNASLMFLQAQSNHKAKEPALDHGTDG